MRLLRLRVRGYRRLADLDLDLDHDRLLVVGPNEAGKSTLQEALVAGLYGLVPAKRGSGHPAAIRQVTPWTGRGAAVSLTFRLDGGRELEADWDFSGEQVRVIDHRVGDDVTAEFAPGTHGWIDLGEQLLGLSGSVFSQLATLGEGQLATISGDGEIRASLLRLTDGGVDVLVEEAVRRLLEGARQSTIPRTTAATRRNQLAQDLEKALAELSEARQARDALDDEVEAIRSAEADLAAAQAEFDAALAESERREAARRHVRSEIDRAEGRLAEAELRMATLVAPAAGAEEGWSDADVDAASRALAAPLDPPPAVRLPPLPAMAITGAGAIALLAGVLAHLVPLIGGALVITAAGVYFMTRGAPLTAPPIAVGSRTYATRMALAAALESVRSSREYAAQKATVAQLELQLAELLESPAARGLRTTGGEWGSIGSGDPQLSAAADRQRDLALELERRRASLERGARQVPEVAGIEERVAEIEDRVRRLEVFGDACRLAAETLERSAEQIRRAYAPRLQAYLGREIGRVTRGRYTEAIVSDAFEVMLRAPETGSMVELRKLSRGTQQQVYLLLRLALLELVSEGTEQMPLLLDDALALSDDGRRRELLAVLEGEARQVIYLTAGEGLANADFGKSWHRVQLAAPQAEEPPTLRLVEPGA